MTTMATTEPAMSTATSTATAMDRAGMSMPRRVSGARSPSGLRSTLRVGDLALGHDATLGQGPDAVQLRLGDRNLLLDVADLLGNRSPVRLRQSRLDLRQHVAPLDRLADARKALVGRDNPAAVEALHHPGAVRIGDHTADQIDGPLRLLDLGDDRADLKEALRGLRDEQGAVGEPLRHVGGCDRRLLRPITMVLSFMGPCHACED